MTYLQFHLIFTLPLFVLLLALNWKNSRFFEAKSWLATATLVFLALTYTTPWDSYLIREKIWDYPASRVIDTFLQIPLEEYFFFFIQTVIGCLATMYSLKSYRPTKTPFRPPLLDRIVTVLFSAIAILPLIYSFDFLFSANPYRYFFLIACWASPILLLQWALGYRILLRCKRPLLLTLIPLTLYFWLADNFAIGQGIWFFPGEQTMNIHLFAQLPVEEALFFLMTNLMVIQGFNLIYPIQ